MCSGEDQSPNLHVVPEHQPDGPTGAALAAARRQTEYESGDRQIDMGWVVQVLEDPKNGGMWEEFLRSLVGAGRHEPTQQEAVQADTNAIIASIVGPNVMLAPGLAEIRDRFLRAIDGVNPDQYQTEVGVTGQVVNEDSGE